MGGRENENGREGGWGGGKVGEWERKGIILCVI